MKKPSYLNCVLTVIAVLLGAIAWMHVSERAPLATEAAAQSADRMSIGVPNAAAQRQAIRDAIERVEREIANLNKSITGATLQVEVTNVKDFVREQRSDQKPAEAREPQVHIEASK